MGNITFDFDKYLRHSVGVVQYSRKGIFDAPYYNESIEFFKETRELYKHYNDCYLFMFALKNLN